MAKGYELETSSSVKACQTRELRVFHRSAAQPSSFGIFI